MTEVTPSECSLLVLPDGRLLVHNLTPELSALLLAIQPENPDLSIRVTALESSDSHQTTRPKP